MSEQQAARIERRLEALHEEVLSLKARMGDMTAQVHSLRDAVYGSNHHVGLLAKVNATLLVAGMLAAAAMGLAVNILSK